MAGGTEQSSLKEVIRGRQNHERVPHASSAVQCSDRVVLVVVNWGLFLETT
jgi:hypothetical protein